MKYYQKRGKSNTLHKENIRNMYKNCTLVILGNSPYHDYFSFGFTFTFKCCLSTNYCLLLAVFYLHLIISIYYLYSIMITACLLFTMYCLLLTVCCLLV
jgi:hypothetical protein